MAYRPLTDIPISLLTSSSTMASGYVLEAYVTGTTTPATLYSDANGTSAGASVTLDARGEPTTIKRVWLDTAVNYKLILKTGAGVEVWTADPVYGAGIPSDEVNPKTFGAKGDGVTDDTAAIQAALDYCATGSGGTAYTNAKKLVFPNGVYIITRPLMIGGDNLYIDGSNCTIRKTTNNLPVTTYPNISSDIPGGAVNPNQNAIFTTTTRLRFSTIENFNIEGQSGVSTPIGIWAVGNENIFRNIYMRNISVGMHIPSMWTTTVEHVVVRSPTSHGFWWDRDRVSGTGQSGTSVHFSNCAVFSATGRGFFLYDVDYVSFDACACDGSLQESYFFGGCSGISGNIAFERMNAASTAPAILMSGVSSGSLVIDSYDDTARAYPVIQAAQTKINLFGLMRTNYTQYFSVSSNTIIYAQGLQIIPISGTELDFTKFVAASDSQIFYTTAQSPSTDLLLYQISDNGTRISQVGAFMDQLAVPSTPAFFYGTSKLRVVYDTTTFDTTYSNQIVVPLAEIRKVIPNFDATTWAQTPLALRIVERGNVGVGNWVSIQAGAIIASGFGATGRAYTTIGTASKVLISSIAISGTDLVITLDAGGGTRQRVSCEITPLA